MSEPIPLGEKENLRRVFQGLDALRHPESVAREVVALLNAEGGEIWVGLGEQQGRAVAVEPVPDPQRQRRRLSAFLNDAIEPAVPGREVEIQEIENEEGGSVLRLRLHSDPASRPYALLTRNGLRFLLREGQVTRPMSRRELAQGFGKAQRRITLLESAPSKLIEERTAFQQKKRELLWLGLEPIKDLRLEPGAYRDLLIDPTLSRNRRIGWTFQQSQHAPIEGPDGLVTHPEELKRVEIRTQGGLRFTAPLSSLYWKGPRRDIWPLSLLEHVISALRLAKTVYRDVLATGDFVVADLALLGIAGWALRPGSPSQSPVFSLVQPVIYHGSRDLVGERPLVFAFQEIEATPDFCGYRLIARVYEAFGLDEEQIPAEFDRKAGRLILPE